METSTNGAGAVVEAAAASREDQRAVAELGFGGGIGRAPDGYPGHVTFYVQLPDAEAALTNAESLGGTRMMGPDEVPGVGIVIGLFSDPEGHTIGVMSQAS